MCQWMKWMCKAWWSYEVRSPDTAAPPDWDWGSQLQVPRGRVLGCILAKSGDEDTEFFRYYFQWKPTVAPLPWRPSLFLRLPITCHFIPLPKLNCVKRTLLLNDFRYAGTLQSESEELKYVHSCIFYHRFSCRKARRGLPRQVANSQKKFEKFEKQECL